MPLVTPAPRDATLAVSQCHIVEKGEWPFPLGQGQSFQHTSGGPPEGHVDPTVSHTRVAAAGPQAGGGRLMGGHEAGRWAEHVLLFAMLVSGAGISAKSPRDVSGDGTWQGTLPLCADGSPALVLGPSPPPLPGWPCFLLPPPPSTPCPGTCRSWQHLAHRPGVACLLAGWPRGLLP